MLKRDENGTGIVGTSFGAAVFMAFLLLATHALLGLYASTIIRATTWDTARQIARSSDTITSEQVVASARRELNGFDNVDIVVTENPAGVTVTTSADRPTFLPKALQRTSSLGRLSKTAHARIETWQ